MLVRHLSRGPNYIVFACKCSVVSCENCSQHQQQKFFQN
jgi:hypothetical protein